ncbi:MAG: hypothetical protein ACJAQT_004933 [Akkermansiaceae bacterium]|jgi:hypothetical protein
MVLIGRNQEGFSILRSRLPDETLNTQSKDRHFREKVALFTRFFESGNILNAVERGDQKLFFNIDYYDQTLKWGSEDPSDPEKTTRVMTLMLALEY